MDWRSFLEAELESRYHVTGGLLDEVDDADLDWKPQTGENWMSMGQLFYYLKLLCPAAPHRASAMNSENRSHAVSRLSLLALAAVTLGCSATSDPAPPPTSAPPEGPPAVSAERLAELESALASERQTAAELAHEVAELRRQLAEERTSRSSLEERYATLEHELASAVEEVLRTTAVGRGVHDRAFATSRISEVRVQLESMSRADDPEVVARLQPARELLARADRALAEENYGGASYLAERAGEAIRRARIVAEIRASSDGAWGELIPIIPPRRMRITANANLRAGPGIEAERIGGVTAGAEVRALARSGEWLQVETDSGLRAWLHSRLAQQL